MEELTLGKLGKCEKKRLCRLSMPAPKKSTGLNSGDKRFTQEKRTSVLPVRPSPVALRVLSLGNKLPQD